MTDHEDDTPHAHEAIVRAPFDPPNPHTLELASLRFRAGYCRLREPPGAGASDDTGPDLRIKLPACHHQPGEGRDAPPGSVEVAAGIDAVPEACESQSCPRRCFSLMRTLGSCLSFRAR